MELNGKIVGCPLSAGINSAAVLCRLIELDIRPKELHIFYAHFTEHSPDSMRFVHDLIELAEKSFPVVKSEIRNNSVLEYFERDKMIPHPTFSPCSRALKIAPMAEYNAVHGVQIDLIGYVRNEQRRIKNQEERSPGDLFFTRFYPISDFDEEWCFEVVKKHLGWYPAIYDLRWSDEGFVSYVKSNLHRFDEHYQKKLLKKCGTNRRVFNHNNCLPCKNMHLDDLLAVEYFYPEYMKAALSLSGRLNAHWGRDADSYYTTFGREDYEPGKCDICSFD